MIKVSDIPSTYNVDHWLYKSLNTELPEDKYANEMFEFDLDIDTQSLEHSCKEAFEKFGWFGCADIFSSELKRVTGYGGLSLVYNKDYAYPIEDVHAHTLGYPRLKLPDFFFENPLLWKNMLQARVDKDFFNILNNEGYREAILFLASENIIGMQDCEMLVAADPDTPNQVIKNTYTDTYSFNRLTPAAMHGEIGKITKKFKRTIVRSRLASLNTLKAEQDYPGSSKDRLWHIDASWFKEFRFNISVSTLDNLFTIQLHDDNGPEFTYKPGTAYVWDTDIQHAHFSQKIVDYDRINLIYAVSPWFDYNEEDDSWAPNEFYMKKHPVDMLLEGDIIDIGFKDVRRYQTTSR